MKKYIFAIAFFLITFVTSLNAAPRQHYSFNWEMGKPLGNYKSYVNNYSTRGIGFNAQVFVHRNIAVGLQLSWHSYYRNTGKETINTGNGSAFTGYTYNHMEDLPISAHVYYHIIPDYKYIQPYIGFAIGATYTLHEILVQDLVLSDKNWGFNMMPEVGVFVPFGDAPVGLNLYARYMVDFNEYSYQGQQMNPYQCLNVGVGITFKFDKK